TSGWRPTQPGNTTRTSTAESRQPPPTPSFVRRGLHCLGSPLLTKEPSLSPLLTKEGVGGGLAAKVSLSSTANLSVWPLMNIRRGRPAESDRPREGAAQEARPAHDPLRGRNSPLEQEPARRAASPCRGRNGNSDRGNHGEPVLRGQCASDLPVPHLSFRGAY